MLPSPIEGGDGNREFLLGGIKALMSNRFTIARLGAQGDGIADTPEGPVFIPFALPGEVVTAARVKDRGTLMAVDRAVARPHRARLPAFRRLRRLCRCSIWRQTPIASGSGRRSCRRSPARGIDAAGCGRSSPASARSRRRAVFSARRAEGGIVLGYNQASSHHIVDISECPVVVPEIESADRQALGAGRDRSATRASRSA